MGYTLENTIHGWAARGAKTNAEGNHPLYVAICGLAGLLNEQVRAAREAAEAKAAAEYAAFLASHPVVYVRFGNVPESGKSRNYRDDIEEPGVSCYEGRLLADGSYFLLMNTTSLASFVREGFMGERPAYLLRGELAGKGADGEPCVAVTSAKRIRKGTRIQYCAGSFSAK